MSYPHSAFADVRVWFVSFSLFAFTISCSLIILLAMEVTSSDLLFTPGSDIHTYAIVSASLASTVLVGTFFTVVSVWFHLRRIQLPSIVGTTVFSLTIAFTVFWAASLLEGHWEKHMQANYHAKYWAPFVNRTMIQNALLDGSVPFVSSPLQREITSKAKVAVARDTDSTQTIDRAVFKEANLKAEIDGEEVRPDAALSLLSSNSLSSYGYESGKGNSEKQILFADVAFLKEPSSTEETIAILKGLGRGNQISSPFRFARSLIENCPEAVPSLHCCGWEQRCPLRCNLTTTCKRAAESEASDFAIKLIVVSSLIMLMAAACAGITLWRNCGRLSDALGDD